jgi:hypothetical protein
MRYETVPSHMGSKRSSATSKNMPTSFQNEANMNEILRVWFSTLCSLIRNPVLSTSRLFHAQPTQGSEQPSPSYVLPLVTEPEDSTPPLGTNLLLF